MARPIPLFPEQEEYTSKRDRKKQRKQGGKNTGLHLHSISPLTPAQEDAFESYQSGQNVLLHGVAGTGKTFISLYLALADVLKRRHYDSVTIFRSIVPTRDMGFLPGNQKEKSKAYESPYYGLCTDLFGRGDAYDILKSTKKIDFQSTSFLRGTTINNSVIIVDECQNMTFHELDSIITRLGENCRLIVCGDYQQSDLLHNSDRNGIKSFMKIIKGMQQFDAVEFSAVDIVRSPLVKSYIISKLNHGLA
jgi:phosphate starvation-inducible protein PhoH